MSERRSIARKSIIITGMGQICSYILNFVTRRIILITIGVEYLGLNSTLSQILGALSVTELGIQGVIVYRLYKPVVEGDRQSICELMSVVRFFYRVVALIIFGGAIVLMPFLRFLITDVSMLWSQVYMAWVMMAASSALSYTMNYNSTVLFANQKQYLYQGIHLILNLAIVCINLTLLYCMHSYFLYLLLGMVNTISGNGVLLLLRRKLYPWIRYVKVSRELIREVAESTLDMFAGRVSAYIFNSTDNIVISALISTTVVGYVGNYTTISRAVATLISSLCGPIQALVGNMLAEGTNTKLSGFVKRYSYILYIIGMLLVLPTALLLDDFVILLYGKEYVIDKVIAYLLIADLYLCTVQSAVGSMLDADGQFKIQKKFYMISSLINIVLSAAGAVTFGAAGVILGTVIGRFYLWICRAYDCYKYVVRNTKEELAEYILYSLKMTVVFLCTLAALKFAFNRCLPDVSLMMFILKGIISVITVLLVQLVIFGRSKEFQYAMELSGLEKMIGRRRKNARKKRQD